MIVRSGDKMSETREYTKVKESVQVLSQAFADHVNQNRKTLQTLEKNMEYKTLNSTSNELGDRLSQLEQSMRGMISSKTTTQADKTAMHAAELGSFFKSGKVSGKGMSTDSDGNLVVSKTISELLWYEVCYCPLVANARHIDVTGKVLKLVIDEADSSKYAQWAKLGYDNKVDTMKQEWKVAEIGTNVCCASTTVTKDTLDDMPETSVQKWINGLLGKSFGEQLTHAMLYGDSEKSLEGIYTYAAANSNKIKTVSFDGALLSGLLEIMSAMDVQYVNQSAWYMSQSFFTALLKQILDHSGQQFVEMLKMTANDKGYTYTLLGKPVYVISQMREDTPVMLADLNSGYYLAQHENGNCKRSDDYDLDVVRYGYRLRVGGKVVNPKAFVLGMPKK